MSNVFQPGHALVIGVGADLPNTIQDAEGLAALLQDEGRCAYPSQQVHLLTGPEATRDAVLAALDALAQRTDAESIVVVYFSGHGYQISTPMDDVYFLMPYDYDVNQLKSTAIKGSEFTAKLRAIPAQKLLVLLDCCHAGGVGEAKAPYIEEMSKAPVPPGAVALLAEGGGRVLIASSQEDEESYAGKPYSAFTLALIEALAGVGVAKKDGFVRVADLALHTRQVVPGRTNDKQHPVLYFEHADNFVLAYYAGGDEHPKGLPFATESIEIEPEPGAWQGEVHGSGAVAQGPGATALGERAVQVRGDVDGDVVTGNKTTAFDQRGQTIHGSQTNIRGDVSGPVLSGQFNGPTAVGGGEAVDMRGSQGALYKPSGPVKQHWGDSIRITGDGNVIGDNNRVNVDKSQTTGITVEEFRRLLRDLQDAVRTSSLDSETREMVESDLKAVEVQAVREKPNRAVIFGRLNGILSVLATADGVWGLTERARPLAERALEWAQRLF
jgi:hypothetical protein